MVNVKTHENVGRVLGMCHPKTENYCIGEPKILQAMNNSYMFQQLENNDYALLRLCSLCIDFTMDRADPGTSADSADWDKYLQRCAS